VHPSPTPLEVKAKEKRFFFEKKKQKTFAPAGFGNAFANARSKQSFFASFCSQKEDSYLLFEPTTCGLMLRHA